jgi:cephalosporin-C deacetylase-like acetyl esterase
MKTNNLAILTRAIKLLLSFLLAIVYCWTAITPTIAQVKKADAQTDIPLVSNEVYQTIVQFFEYDRNIPLDARIVSKEAFQGANKEKIVFTGVNHSQVPALLIIPKDGKETHPVVLIVDGIEGFKDSWPLGGLVTKSLLKSGFAVMICDAVYHGERTYENGFESPPWPYQYPYLGRQMIIQTAIEYRRALDYLSTRTDIDNSRIGMLGLSMGGMITFELTSIDSRIKSAVAGLTPPLKEHEFQSFTPSTFASRININSFLMFMGNKDDFYTMKEARQLYDMIPIINKEFVEYNTGHEVTVEYVTLVTDWFVKNLKP